MTYERFLEKIKQLRKSQGISLQTVANELGMANCQYSNIERGKCGFKVEDFLSVCKVLTVSPKHVFDEDMLKLGEYKAIIENLKKLPDRDCRIVKDLVMLMSLAFDDL